ncbi:MAG: hypothetical protein P4L03_04870 [Terracidiphilus sp.]|nr:hypothetical protein [Terracidiphilus sp.]
MPSESPHLPENVASALAYVTFLPAIFFLMAPHYSANRTIRFHAWQSVLLTVVAFAVSFILTIMTIFGVLFGAYSVLRLNFAVFLIWLIVWALCIERALAGKRFKLPVLSTIAEKQARL